MRRQRQISLRFAIRALFRKLPSASLTEAVKIEKKAENLAKRVRNLVKEASTVFKTVDLDSLTLGQWEGDEVEVCVCEDDCACTDLEELPMGRAVFDKSLEELSILPLPSNCPPGELPSSMAFAVEAEVAMRVAQLDGLLEDVRGIVSEKSFLFRAKRALTSAGRPVTRSYDDIKEIEDRLRLLILQYECGRWALHRLAGADKYPRFQKLTGTHTKAVTAVYDPNRPGERNAESSWIWDLEAKGDISKDSYLAEGKHFASTPHICFLQKFLVHRVNWIRAKSRVERWTEEVTLLEAEMEWYKNFMFHAAEEAKKRANLSLTDGQRAAAFRQEDVWRRFALEGQRVFDAKSSDKVKLQGRGDITGEQAPEDDDLSDDEDLLHVEEPYE